MSLSSGVGGFAQTRMAEQWVYPVSAVFNTTVYRSMTEHAIAGILRENLTGYTGGKERDLARHLVRTCRRHAIDPAFVLSLISVESGFRANVVSHAGAVGLLQVMPDTAKHVARLNGFAFRGRETLKDPFVNLTIGIAYMAELRDRYRGMSPYFQLAAFNLGPARLDQLRSRPGFRPSATLKYYEDVMRGVDRFRYYSSRRIQKEAALLEAAAARRVNRGKLSRSMEKPLRSAPPEQV